MGSFFVNIYDLFSRRKPLLWTILLVTTILMTCAVVRLSYVEEITNFFPGKQKEIGLIFDNLKAKDKLVVMFSSATEESDIDQLMEGADAFEEKINQNELFSRSATLTLTLNDALIDSSSAFVYDYLPLFLDDESYEALDSITRPEAIAARMKQNYNHLLSPIGGYISEHIYRDPLGLGANVLKELQSQSNNVQYAIIDNRIFSPDSLTLMGYIDLKRNATGGEKERLVGVIESIIDEFHTHHPCLTVRYFGAPAVAASNSRQIKTDSMVTLNIAILIVIIFITLAFKNRYSVLLVLTPVLYGALFSLSIIYLVQGEISLIAVGSGSVIFGIALSYSIHILSHTNHCRDMRQLIAELAYPLTVGSFTTIGAFAGLLFTNSKLLQDFGLFSSLTLVGTTLFALLFLPHFLTINETKQPQGKLLNFVDKISNIRLDRSKPLIASILLLTLVCGIFFNSVGFDSNMMKLNFEAPHLKEAEERLNAFTNIKKGESNVLFIASSEKQDEAVVAYRDLCLMLDSLKESGAVMSYSSVGKYLVPDALQRLRLAKWNQFWSEKKCEEVMAIIDSEAAKLGFDDHSFAAFRRLIAQGYQPLNYNSDGRAANLFPDWVSSSQSVTSFIAQVKLTDSSKPQVYEHLFAKEGIIAADRAFFAGRMAEDVNHNFYLILYISGLLIFFALLLSYGRLELTIISFLPMFISWVIIIGIMSICKIEFNIVTIILSTFIFGIGDDFSIFIMDGLISEHKEKTRILAQHKTAIFFSAFTIVVGMGALVFAKHPAMHSLGVISIIGILVVILVAYTIQPFIFRLFISAQTERGGFPYTLLGVINTLYAFGLFLVGCIAIKVLILLLLLIPIGSLRRKELVHCATQGFIRLFLKLNVTVKVKNINEHRETFKSPSVIIANHQSFIDILILLALYPKLVMITNSWVWHSPFFGKIVRYLDFYHTENGYESLAESLKEKVAQGYSVIVFPEGTRSVDCTPKRFHKGAFYLAEQLKLDILPILIYGNGLVSSKQQPFYIKKGLLVSKLLPRIPSASLQYGTGYQERSKSIARYFKEEYHRLYEELNRASINPYYRDALIKNYIYKGPVLEWYMRVKLRMEKWYDTYDRLLPRNGYIVDLGCGYGAMSLMLGMLSNKRKITGVDYDEKKIALANACYAKSHFVEFVHSDIRSYDLPSADGYIISDVLHYLNHESQRALIARCIASLNPGGVILIREGDASASKRHHRTEETERWSTKIIKFNKTDGPLCFLSKRMIEEVAEAHSMELQIVNSGAQTSNTLFVLTRK